MVWCSWPLRYPHAALQLPGWHNTSAWRGLALREPSLSATLPAERVQEDPFMASERDVVPDTVTRAVAVESFPWASTYDPAWILENQMGPNVLWLTEYLTQSLDLRPTMRVLDLGCGKGTEDRLTAGP